jgi:hypothetical protein
MKEKPGHSPELRHRKQVNKLNADEDRNTAATGQYAGMRCLIAAITRNFLYAAILY